MPQTFADGIRQAGDAVKLALADVLPTIQPMPEMAQMPSELATQDFSGMDSGIIPALRNLLPDLSMPMPDGSIGDALRSALPNLAAPLPVGPAPAPALAGGGGNTSSVSLTIQNLTVTAASGDVESIGAQIEDKLRDVWRRIAEENDTQIRA